MKDVQSSLLEGKKKHHCKRNRNLSYRWEDKWSSCCGAQSWLLKSLKREWLLIIFHTAAIEEIDYFSEL